MVSRAEVIDFLGSAFDFESEVELRDFLQQKVEEVGIPNFVVMVAG